MFVIIDEYGNSIKLKKGFYSLAYISPTRNGSMLIAFNRVGVEEIETYIALSMYVYDK